MNSPARNSTSDRRPALSRGAHSRWYILATVSLAVFLTVVTAWRKPPDRFTSSIVVQQTGRHAAWNDRPAIVGAIIDIHQEHAHGGDHRHDSAPSDHDHGDANQHPAHSAVSHGQPHLLVDVVSDMTNTKRITIWCSGKTAAAALHEASELGETYVRRVNRPTNVDSRKPERDDAQAAVLKAQRDLTEAKDALQAFRSANAKALAATPQNNVGKATDSPAQLHFDDSALTVRAAPNPQWTELNDRLAVLRAARNQLLEQRTPEHPEVRDLQWQVEKLETELAATPRSLVPPAAQDAAPPVEEAVTVEPSPALLRQLKQLEANLESARAKCDQATAKLADIQKKKQTTATAVASVVAPAKIVSSHGAGVTVAGVCGGLTFGLLLGVIVSRLSLRVRQPAALVSLQRVEALGVPVVASLTTGDGPALPPPQAFNPVWVRWMTFLCELMIGAIVLLLLLTALADWQFAAHLVRDPLGALAEAASRLM